VPLESVASNHNLYTNKTKELTNHLPLSLRAIEKRKSNLKLITADFEEVGN